MNSQSFIRKIIYLFIFMLWVLSGPAQNPIITVEKLIAQWQNSKEMGNAGISLSIADAQTEEVLIQTDSQLSLVPASILKAITTATALEIFGPDYRFKTALSYSGNIKNDTLYGDLFIIGGGDPTLGSAYFPENKNFQKKLIEALQNNNIKFIKGNLILDASIYESQSIPDTWVWEDIGNYFGAGASGISVSDNLYEIHLKSENVAGKLTQIVQIIPEIPDLELANEVLSSEIGSDQAYVYGSPMENRRIIRGTIPKNQSDYVVNASVPNPSALLAFEFKKALSASTITISGDTKYEKVKPEATQLTIIESPELSEIIKVTNHESVNLFAEHLLKHLAFQKYGLGTTKDGCKLVTQFWKEKGLDMTGFFMHDGSGLSRFNAITAKQMTDVLNYMSLKSNYAKYFVNSLPTAGHGTLQIFNPSSFPEESLRAKSGSMTRVRCYSGYLKTELGRKLSFAIMLNNFSCSQKEATRKVEELLVELRKL